MLRASAATRDTRPSMRTWQTDGWVPCFRSSAARKGLGDPGPAGTPRRFFCVMFMYYISLLLSECVSCHGAMSSPSPALTALIPPVTMPGVSPKLGPKSPGMGPLSAHVLNLPPLVMKPRSNSSLTSLGAMKLEPAPPATAARTSTRKLSDDQAMALTIAAKKVCSTRTDPVALSVLS